MVFADEAARRRLEEIIHPRVRARTAELLAAAAAPDAIVVNDVPLLVEAGLAPSYHLVIVVQTAGRPGLARLARDRGMTAEEAERADRRAGRRRPTPGRGRRAADQRRRPATNCTPRVDALWRDRLLPYEENLRDGGAVRPGGWCLAEPDPTWPQQYARLTARIRHALGPADLRIDHIGSTAVPGLPAKDVIDLLLAVPSPRRGGRALADRLAEAGFPRRAGAVVGHPAPAGGDRGRSGCTAAPTRAARCDLHVRVAGSPGWRFALLMRDHLRADPEQRAGYLAVKRELAAPHRTAALRGGQGPVVRRGAPAGASSGPSDRLAPLRSSVSGAGSWVEARRPGGAWSQPGYHGGLQVELGPRAGAVRSSSRRSRPARSIQ